MSVITRCPQCGNVLSEDLGGRCPECLLGAGLAGSSAGGDGPQTVDYAGPKTEGPKPGQDFGGYHLVRALGQGGMGTVFEAEEQGTGRRLALKVLSHSLDSPGARQRFLREGRLAASVNHPHSVYVFGTEEIDGAPVITMELVKGGTLQERVRTRGPLPQSDAADAILQVIDGLEAAHAVGVLHRDVKPSNCFVDAEGAVKIGDFGLSVSKIGRGEMQLSTSGVFLGTPAFASPEQLKGDELDQRSDLYAVGVTLFYLLTGKIPFEAEQMVHLVATVLERPAPDVRSLRPEISRELAAVVAKCLEKDPARRYRSYAELRTALLPFSSLVPTPATPARRYAAGAIDFCILYVAMSLVGLVWLAFGGDPSIYTIERRIGGLVATLVVWFAYYAVPEGLFGATVGEWLLGLRVVRHRTMNAPGIPRATLRNYLYYLIPVAPQWIYSFFGPSLVDADGRLIVNLDTLWPALLVGATSLPLWALMFVTMRRGNGYAAVHDWLSDIRVVTRPVSVTRPALTLTPADVSPPLEGAPAFGPYHILATLGDDAAGQWKVGYDARLLRRVWLRIVPPGSEPAPAALQRQSRSGRVRWLTGRRSAEPGAEHVAENWDAFEAPSGQPLLTLLDHPHEWDEVRYWLLDLAEELSAALKDGTLPAVLSLDRVWITADGRAKLCDFPVPGLTTTTAGIPTRPGEVGPIGEFLHIVAVVALNGRRDVASTAIVAQAPRNRLDPMARDFDTANDPFARPLPLHARPILYGLRWAERPEVIVAELRANIQKPARVTRRRRWGMFAAVAGIPVAIGLISLVSNAPNMIALWREPDLAHLKDALVRYKPPFGIGPEATPEQKKDLDVYITGSFGPRIQDPAFWKNSYLARNLLPEYVTLAKQIVERTPAPSAEELEAATRAVDPLIHVGDRRFAFSGTLMPVLIGVSTVAVFLWLEALPSVIAALVFGGGPLWRVFGLAPVSADGRPASRFRFAWRQVLAWAPLALFPILLALLAPLFHVVVALVFLPILMVAVIVASTFLSERSFPDRLAKTWLVNR